MTSMPRLFVASSPSAAATILIASSGSSRPSADKDAHRRSTTGLDECPSSSMSCLASFSLPKAIWATGACEVFGITSSTPFAAPLDEISPGDKKRGFQ